MHVFHEIEPLRGFIAAHRQDRRVAFVPTMGALHHGHGACVRIARAVDRGLVVCSVFVNPAQFAPGEDFDRYPRTLEADLDRLREWRCDAVFAPALDVIYPHPQRAWVDVEGLSEPLCGRFRPGHFRGVATVVSKLIHIVRPDVAVFGQKDAQQALIVRALVTELDLGIELKLAATVREADGLAVSSRNRYLEPAQRRAAVALSEALGAVRRLVEAGERDVAALRRALAERVAAAPGAVVDYAEVVDADTLQPVDRLTEPVVAVLAVRFGATRLIDNLPLPVPPAD